MQKKIYSHSMTKRQFLKGSVGLVLLCSVSPSLMFKPRHAHASSASDVEETSRNVGGKSAWRNSSDLTTSELEKYKMDLTPWEKTPRNKKYSYVAARLEPPYTATEIIYMLTVGQYFPWWIHEAPMGGMKINSKGGLNFYLGQQVVWSDLTPDTLKDYLYQWPENKVYMWVLDRYLTPQTYKYTKILQNVYRCGDNQKKYSEKWDYYYYNQKTNLLGNSLYSDDYYQMSFAFGDTAMIPWYYTWRFLGTDNLYQDDTIRFPRTRNEIHIRNWDAKSIKTDPGHIKTMGDDYPAYNEDGAVPCYVVEGLANSHFFKTNHKRLILWIDMYGCRELRRERYDLNNNLMAITEAKARLELKDKGRWGYSNLIYLAWGLKNDLLSANHYDFHRPPRTFKVNVETPETYFRPNPVFMDSKMIPVPRSAMVFRDPEKFYLRPKLMIEKFPEDRKIQLSDNLIKRIKLQNKENKLVFV